MAARKRSSRKKPARKKGARKKKSARKTVVTLTPADVAMLRNPGVARAEVESALEVLGKFFDGPHMANYRGMRPKLTDLKIGLETVFRRQRL